MVSRSRYPTTKLNKLYKMIADDTQNVIPEIVEESNEQETLSLSKLNYFQFNVNLE